MIPVFAQAAAGFFEQLSSICLECWRSKKSPATFSPCASLRLGGMLYASISSSRHFGRLVCARGYACLRRRRGRERHENVRRSVEGRQGGRDNKRRDLTAVPLAVPRTTEQWRNGASAGRPGSHHHCAGSNDRQDSEPVQRGIRGEQGRDQGRRADETRVRRRLPRWGRDSSAGSGGGPSAGPDACAGARADTKRVFVPVATASDPGPGSRARELRRVSRCRRKRNGATGSTAAPVRPSFG